MIRCQDAVKEYWKDSWPQLKWICDIAEIVRVNPEIDWEWVFEQGKNSGNQRLLFFCLSLAKNLVGAPLPRDVLRSIETDSKANELTSDVISKLLFRNANSPNRFLDRRRGILERHRFCVRLKERIRDRIPYHRRFCREYRSNARRAIEKKENRELLLLPASLSYLYYVLAFIYYLLRPIWQIGRLRPRSLRPIMKS